MCNVKRQTVFQAGQEEAAEAQSASSLLNVLVSGPCGLLCLHRVGVESGRQGGLGSALQGGAPEPSVQRDCESKYSAQHTPQAD